MAVRDMIVSLELRPGAVIDERALTEQLGIGRTPVREALRRLAIENLVEVFPRRGMFVTKVEIRDLASLSEVRITLESQAARLAAERATDVEREELAALARVFDDGKRRGVRELMELDERVHRTIYRCAHNPFLESTLGEYYMLALRIWHLALDEAKGLEGAVYEHGDVLESIVERRAELAEKLMREHVRDFEQSMRRVLLGDA